MEAKTCPKCGFHMSLDGFHRSRSNRDGRAIWCKTCIAAYQKNYRAVNAATIRQRKRQDSLKTKYGLTVAAWQDKLSAQGGACALCGTTEPGGKGWAVDHNHHCCPGQNTCGQCVRGILCQKCNHRLAALEDFAWFDRAQRYLKDYD